MGTDPSIRRIAIAVRNLDKARGLFETLLGAAFAPSPRETGEEVRALVWNQGSGEPTLELVQPLTEDSPVARSIRKRGEGIHHVTLAVADLEDAIQRISDAGGRVVRTDSYYRTPEGERLREAFVHPKDAHGVLFHLVEEAPRD